MASEPKSDTHRARTHRHAPSPNHHIPPRGPVGLQIISEHLDRVLAPLYPAKLVIGSRPNFPESHRRVRRSGKKLLRALKSFLLISIIYASRGVVCRPQNRNPTPTVGEPQSIHPSHHTCQISILRPFWTPLRCVDRKKEQKGIAKP